MNELLFYGNAIMELQEDMLEVMKLLKKFFRLDFSGLLSLKMLKNMLNPVMSINI